MFISKQSLPRRTFLRGIGATVALPLLDAMVPALTAAARTAAAPVRRLGFIYFPNGANMFQWPSAGDATKLELSPTLAPLAGGARRRDGVVRPRQRAGGRLGRRERRPPAQRVVLAQRRASEEDRGRRRAGRHDDRPDRRRRVRQGDAAGLARAVPRAGRLGRELRRHRLQLRLHRHHRLADADDAPADGAQPAQRVQPPVRRRRHGRGAHRAAAARPQRARLGDRGDRRAAAADRPPRTGSASPSTSTPCGRSSGASSAPRRTARPCRTSTARSGFPTARPRTAS